MMVLSDDGKAETFSYFRVGVGGQGGGIISRHHMAFHLGDAAPKFDKNPSIGRYYLLSAEESVSQQIHKTAKHCTL